MKQILTIALIIFSASAFAQDKEVKFNCYGVQSGVYNKYTKEFDDDVVKESNYDVTLYKGAFRMENKAGSLYILKSQRLDKFENSERKVFYYNAIDEEGISMKLNIIKFKATGNVQLQCFYSDMVLYFHLSPIEE